MNTVTQQQDSQFTKTCTLPIFSATRTPCQQYAKSLCYTNISTSDGKTLFSLANKTLHQPDKFPPHFDSANNCYFIMTFSITRLPVSTSIYPLTLCVTCPSLFFYPMSPTNPLTVELHNFFTCRNIPPDPSIKAIHLST